MFDAPEPIIRQRELLRRFRAAYRTREKAEGEITAFCRSQEQAADTTLAEAKTAAQQRCEQLVEQAEGRLKTRESTARTVRDKGVQTAQDGRAKTQAAVASARNALTRAGLDHLLTGAEPKPPSPVSGGTAQSQLRESVAEATASSTAIERGVTALEAERKAAADRFGMMVVFAGVILVLVVWLSITGVRNLQENRANARATAARETVIAREAAAQSTATAEAAAAQATSAAKVASSQATVTAIYQTSVGEMPDEFRPMYERFGIVFLRVPAGDFVMGSDWGELGEQPVHTVHLDEYWISLTEVTNAQYAPFIEAGGYSDRSLWTDAGWRWNDDTNVTKPGCWNNSKFNSPDQPVVCVSWYEAVAYAAWLSRESGLDVRLPTEAEWEKAARGTDARTYPWGEQMPDDIRGNYNDRVGKPSLVGWFPAGASPYGVLDMAGNVWEWTSSRDADYPYAPDDGREVLSGRNSRIARGGSWRSSEQLVRSAYRAEFAPNFIFSNRGLRLAASKK